jgi:regulator of sirC expression with transglutaminase-like and TPR domain
MSRKPDLCRPEAFFHFAEQLRNLDTTEGLLNGAIAISMHALEDIRPRTVETRIDELAMRVRSRVRSESQHALVAHLHDVLFDEEQFRGNSEDYYNPLNSYLSAVLETKRGIPITLCLVYKVVAERLGLSVEGVNSPGHFLARVNGQHGGMIVDPFLSGGVLNDEEAFDRVEEVTGRPVPRTPQYLAAATHSQWLSRILVNLQHIFASTERRADLVAMSELQSLLDYSLY